MKPERAGTPPGRSDFQWRVPAVVLLLALIVPLMNVIPTLEGALRDRPPGREVFLGFRFMITDHFQYGSFARQAEEGRFFFENMFTTEPQRPSYVLVYFSICGLVMRATGLSFPVVWELLRVLFGFGLMLAAWYFICFFFEGRGQRLLAYVLVGVSGGLGWLAGLMPQSLFQRPGFGFLTDPAHFQWNWSTFSTMLVALWIAPIMFFLIACILVLYRKPIPAPARWAAIFTLGPLIWFIHPHSGNVAYLAFGLFGLAPAIESLWNLNPIPWRKTVDAMGRVMPFILSFLLVVLYLSWASKDAIFAAGGQGAAQWNPTYSVFWYPFTYGLLIPLAILGIRWSGSLPEKPKHMIFAWLAASFILSVNPLFSGVKYQFLMHLPLAILSAHGIQCLREKSAWARSAAKGVPALVVGAALFLHGPVTIVRDMVAPVTEPYAYASRSDVEAMEFLDGQPRGTVLCGYRACGAISYLSAKKVFTGHWLLTLDQQRKNRELAGFFNAAVPVATKRVFLGQHGIRYVYVGPAERKMGRVDPALGLEVIYDKDGITIYRVP